MRHRKKFNHLGRKAAHRKAMLSNMACFLIEHKRIKTTLAKAKALRVYVEPLITKSKNDTTHSRRTVFSYLKQKQAVTELFGDIATKVADRPGGYTRILKLSNRLGDNAEMAYIELVDYNETYVTDKPKKKKTRRRGGTKKSTPSEVVESSENLEVVEKDSSEVEDTVDNVEITTETDNEPKEEKTEDKIEMESVEEVNEDPKNEVKNDETNDSSEEVQEDQKKDDSNESTEEEKAE